MQLKLAEMTFGDWIGLAAWSIGLICMAVSCYTHNHHLSALGAVLVLGSKK